MNENIKQHLENYCKDKGWEINEDTLIETLKEADQLSREEISQHRWWNEYRYTVQIAGMIIGYIDAEANRDESVEDLGYEFDLSTICEMKAVEKTIIVYEPI